MDPSATFLPAYIGEIGKHVTNEHVDNFDHTRFGAEPPANDERSWLRRHYRRFLRRRSLQPAWHTANQIAAAVAPITPHLPGFERLYRALEDDESRSTMLQVLAFRALGHRKVRLPLSTPQFWAGLKRIETLARPDEGIPADFLGWSLPKIDLSPTGFPIALHTLPMAAYVLFVLGQYQCRTAETRIGAGPGAYVIDGGGCWGDTALLFAHLVGPHGRVFSFEFAPKNVSIFRRNLGLNPELEPRVALLEHALWCESDVVVGYESNGPGTKVDVGSTDEKSGAATLSIDDLVQSRSLPRLDFIKLDIEGAELPALRGAERAIRRFRPALAVAVYHSLEDFHAIQAYIASLGLGYRFCLRHFTIHAEETMLFAWPANAPGGLGPDAMQRASRPEDT